ncbi:MAG: hypothetical protein OXI96_10115 [Acidimicrobiaceae bacterium]|nr:hypothetical protein [Acidimicrobiaceae bacterium]
MITSDEAFVEFVPLRSWKRSGSTSVFQPHAVVVWYRSRCLLSSGYLECEHGEREFSVGVVAVAEDVLETGF